MLPTPWVHELWRMAALFGGALLLGWLVGVPHGAFTLALIVYLGWHLYNLYRLERWYQRRKKREPPDAAGIWGEAFNHIYQLQRSNRQRKKRLASILSRFNESTAALPDATVVLTRDDCIEWFNKAAKRYLGLQAKQDIGQRIDNLIRHSRFSEFLARGDFSEPLELVSPLDEQRYLSFRVVPYGNKQKLLVVRDISRLKRLERTRSDFVANVSHELRTPLTVVRGYLENMIDGAAHEAKQRAQCLQQMQAQTERMIHLVEDLLMLSRLENEEKMVACSAVAVPAILVALLDDARTLSGKRGHHVTLESDTSVWLKGRERELSSAFSNLIFNAVLYTPNGGHIALRWYRDDENVCFEVQDDGVGIAAQHVHRLTERFYRVDAGRSREYGGTGLGLAIVKHVLDRHEARLEIESQPGRGSLFRCVFTKSVLVERDAPRVL
ncbi:MAG: phosphate regulon sensor histidine kinase PhoR [Gammaproteobacteria bacterium]|nr:phosphate regulon sensor histidine kinase PhoR [Gammaproteobacteria bacterium]